jgi:PAS domain S-box-containing protein
VALSADGDSLLRALEEARAALRVAEERLEEERRASARRAVEEDVRRDVERALAETLVAVNAGYWETDFRTGRTAWSDGAYKLMGFEPGRVEPSTDLWRERTHPDDYARMMAGPLTENIATIYRIVLPGGVTRWCRSRMNTVFSEDGAPLRMRGILIDVTAEHAVGRQLARLAEVTNRTDNGVVITGLDGRIEWVNEAFTRRSEWTLAEVVGQRPDSIQVGPHTDHAVLAGMWEAARAHQPFSAELLVYSRSGRPSWLHVESRVERDEHGQPTGFIAVETDITERRMASSRDRLTQRLAALLLESNSLETAAQAVVSEMVKEDDIRVAQIWVVDPARPVLLHVAGAATAECGEAGTAFVAASRGGTFARSVDPDEGVGLPGLAWGLRQTCEVGELAATGASVYLAERCERAVAAGIGTVRATPIIGPDGVLGVIELGTTSCLPGHEQHVALLERVAGKFASFLRHDLARKAFRSVFDQSPDALLLVDGDGCVRTANERAMVLFGGVEGVALDTLIEGATELVSARLAPTTLDDAHALHHRPAHGLAGTFSVELSVSVTPGAALHAAIVSVRDLTERHRMEAALTRSLEEKETLLREVHHRVKNNLQIVSSLLTMQGDTLVDADARLAIVAMGNRVRSMALVHQQLYGSNDLQGVDFGEYALTLGQFLKSSLASDASLSFSTDRVEIAIDRALPCGLILNELITNALKHGRSADGSCTILVEVRADGDAFTLTVADRGPGFPVQPTQRDSLGMQLIRSLSRQIRGRLEITSVGGVCVSIRVPLKA